MSQALTPSQRNVVAASGAAALGSALWNAGLNSVARSLVYGPDRPPVMYVPETPARPRRQLKRKKRSKSKPRMGSGLRRRLKLRKTRRHCTLKRLCNFMNQSVATHKHRVRETASYASADKTVYISGHGTTINDLQTACSNLRYFDSVNNTLVTHDASEGTYQRDIRLAITKFATFANNSSVPTRIEVYSCTPKEDTSIEPPTAFANGLIDQGNPSSVSPLVYIKDSIQLKSSWSCKRVIKKTLRPGAVVSCRWFKKQFSFNFALVDVHNFSYQKRYGGHYFMVRVCGPLGHDGTLTTTQIGLLGAGVDAKYDTHYTFSYDAGKDLHDISINDQSNTFTNGGEIRFDPSGSFRTFVLT